MKKTPIVILIFHSFLFLGQNYHSEFEEHTLKTDTISHHYFEGLMCIDSTVTLKNAMAYKNKVDLLIRTFPSKQTTERKEKKRIKKIYKTIHDTFLKKYVVDSYFPDIFNTGNYNCVSATALYSYVFDSLEIPYQIKETPTHVYLVVYPKKNAIYIETTVPGKHAYFLPKESKIKSIIDELILYKLATEKEVLKKGYKKFYEDYFYSKDSISKEALIGIQYYNQGIFNLQSENENRAINSFKKANLFYKSPYVEMVLKSYTIQRIYELNYNTEEDISFFLDLISNEKYDKDISPNMIEAVMHTITEKNDNLFIRRTIKKTNGLVDINKRNICNKVLYEYLARDAAHDENHTQALLDCDALLKIENESKIAIQIVEYIIYKKLSLTTFDLKDLKGFEASCEKYPFLKSNHRYNISLAHLYANISLKNYRNNKKSDGEKYRAKFEALLDNTEVLPHLNKILISQLYQIAGNYFYYKDQYRTSYAIYKKGMSYVPHDSELAKKAQWSKEEF